MGSTATGVGQPRGQGEIALGGRYKSFEATDVAGIGLSFSSPSSCRGLSGGSLYWTLRSSYSFWSHWGGGRGS